MLRPHPRSTLFPYTTLFRSLVVVGRDDEQAAGTDARGGLRELERLGGRVRPDTGDHLPLAADRLGDRPEQVDLLGVREGGRLARRSGRDHRVRSVRDEPARELLRAIEVESVIGPERCDHRGDEGTEGAGHREEASFPGAHPRRGPPDGPYASRPCRASTRRPETTEPPACCSVDASAKTIS